MSYHYILYLPMSKIVLIKRQNKSDWVSCQSITSNLEKVYQDIFQDIIPLEIDKSYDKYDYWKLAEEIFKTNPSKIVFIDHTPHPCELIKALDNFFLDNLPELVFHIFGDFTLQSKQWLSIEDILKKTPLRIICASDKQKLLLENLLNIQASSISIIPFPVDETRFYYKNEKRNDEKFNFLYTGRVSDQKNIIELINTFHHFNTSLNPQTTLTIAGPYDDLGIPFLGKSMKPGAYGLTIENLVQKLKNKNIFLLGNLNHDDLLIQYNKSDAYISLSTHNDEDYGMSPAEALCSGLDCLLTDWAGYSSFKKNHPNNVVLSKVELKGSKNLPDRSDVIKKMNIISLNKKSLKQKELLSKEAHKTLGIKSSKERLTTILNDKNASAKLHSFTDIFRNLASSHIYSPDTPFLKASNGSYTSLYKEIYAPYYEELKYDK